MFIWDLFDFTNQKESFIHFSRLSLNIPLLSTQRPKNTGGFVEEEARS